MTAPARTRPKDRAVQIQEAATRLFSERGYPAVTLDDIGEAVGITGRAVYRHYASKDALLGAIVERSVHGLEQAFATAEADSPGPELLSRLVAAVVHAAVHDRDVTAVYLRESRHLSTDLRDSIRARTVQNVGPWARAFAGRGAPLPEAHTRFVIQAVTGLAMSGIYFASPLTPRRHEDLLTEMAERAIAAFLMLDLTGWPDTPSPAAGTEALRPSSRRERILSSALELIRRQGFENVSIDSIGEAAGISGPGVYRHFRGKEDILAAVFTRTSERLLATVPAALAAAPSPGAALDALASAYIDLATANPDLIAVCLQEERSLSPELQRSIRNDRRSYLREWTTLLRAVRPDLSDAMARATVQGAIGLVNVFAQVPRPDAGRPLRPIVHAALGARTGSDD